MNRSTNTDFIFEVSINNLQKDVSESKNLLDWVITQWNELKSTADKMSFIVRFLSTALRISQIKKESEPGSLLNDNALHILEIWRNIFQSDLARRFQVSLEDIKWVANVWTQKIAEGLTESDQSLLQQKSDISNKLATYVAHKWKLIQGITDKNLFSKEYVTVMKHLLNAKKNAGNDEFLISNIDKLIDAWRLVLTTPYAKRVGLRIHDLRLAMESLGYSHAAVGQVPEKDPPQ